MTDPLIDPPARERPRRCGPLRTGGRLVAVAAVLAAAVTATPLLGLARQERRTAVRGLFARALLRALGVAHHRYGRPPHRGGLVVAGDPGPLATLLLAAHLPARPVTGGAAGRRLGRWGALEVDPDRPHDLPRAVATVARLLRVGGLVLVFPPVTGSPGGRRFRPAPFQAAIDAGAPVVPVSVDVWPGRPPGTGPAALREVLLTRGVRARVRVHPAVYPETGADRCQLARMVYASVREPDPAPPHAVRRLERRVPAPPARPVSLRPPSRNAAA